VEGPPWLDAERLVADAEAHGILIERGDVFFMDGLEQKHCFRMGFSAIKLEKIDEGVRLLAGLVCKQKPAEG
jgi:GntR family transcriptional regulator/MocR family aminotransferase